MATVVRGVAWVAIISRRTETSSRVCLASSLRASASPCPRWRAARMREETTKSADGVIEILSECPQRPLGPPGRVQTRDELAQVRTQRITRIRVGGLQSTLQVGACTDKPDQVMRPCGYIVQQIHGLILGRNRAGPIKIRMGTMMTIIGHRRQHPKISPARMLRIRRVVSIRRILSCSVRYRCCSAPGGAVFLGSHRCGLLQRSSEG